ncbi:protein meaA [Streptomyces europaeiscabiei]|uniref:protein meaA n=1 Tax=Streptomyces europaeiscabiei TaxID=146819 RepID=UPI000628363C|nr:protein meaA [Streptomyces europaeiscabiei]MDX2526938.1 protein meaA [Streptomyces europaeiscabiei]MDX2761244.1 protein meaA [Streptomyces europaeiscabiei]MDX2767295.1 protein meaA [Streptomyces europaeiscabiei]MDX3665224.1 protein meaA [Streptomyces europaeiscabiei]MDX3707589.1 protein meaA [Streptomyces europaeiscabiei]
MSERQPADGGKREKDRPWLMRTYAGHSTAEASNELYRRNLAKGQTGLSVAFDLPTQTGYDSDHILARGEVGRVGVPVAHLGDMRRLFQDIPLEQMNTSMTINATAMWLLALYQVVAEEQGADITQLQGTTQNDIVKEYLSRGTHVFPPGPSLRLTTDMIAYTVSRMPKWNPINICSYHLQEAGATPVQEIAYAMSTAIAVLDAVRDSGQVPAEKFGDVVARISFFVNAGVRFVEEMCKMRAFGRIWDRITRERYGIENAKQRRFRYGVQVNSLGLTEAQPENNVQRIVLEMLAVTLSKDARARAVQLPAWNEALGLPRPWDQQWSLRIQQVLAHESDLLEYEDIFEGSHVIEAKVTQLVEASFAEIERIQEMGGAMAAVESGYLKSQLVSSHAERRARIESGQEKIVGVNVFESTEPNPLTADLDAAIQTVDPAVEARVIKSLQNWRDTRYQPPFNHPRPCKALDRLKEAAKGTGNLMEATLECARAGVTTGEWSGALREVFGEFRAPTGVSSAPVAVSAEEGSAMSEVRRKVELTAKDLNVGKLRFLVGKPGLDGHSNGAEQIAVRARDAGFEVVYQGIRLTPEQIVDAAIAEDVHAVGLSILSGSHAQLVPDVLDRLREAGATDIPVIAGGIIPNADAAQLRAAGVAAVFTPKDFDITGIIGRIVDEIRKANKLDPLEVPA